MSIVNKAKGHTQRVLQRGVTARLKCETNTFSLSFSKVSFQVYMKNGKCVNCLHVCLLYLFIEAAGLFYFVFQVTAFLFSFWSVNLFVRRINLVTS